MFAAILFVSFLIFLRAMPFEHKPEPYRFLTEQEKEELEIREWLNS